MSSTALVVLNVSQQLAAAPQQLQRRVALVSQGGTTQAPQTVTRLTQLSDLISILAGALTITTAVWSGSVVTVTLTAPHGWTTGDVIPVTIAGCTPGAYNGNVNATVTGASTFTYPLVSNPGSLTVPGTVILRDVNTTLAMATTFFAQNNGSGCYVLELGEGTVNEGVTDLSTWLTNNPNTQAATNTSTMYSYMVPRNWDGNANFITFLGNYTAPAAKTYFFVTTTINNLTYYAALKCVYTIVEAPAVGPNGQEFDMAGPLAVTANYNPNSSNQVTPLNCAFVFGVTPYPVAGNQTLFASLATANVGWIDTGAEGGISDAIVRQGLMQDGNTFNYWYAADNVQLNLDLNLANEIINGSNNPQAPLYYDQPGIDRLQRRMVQTLQTAISAGLLTGQILILKLPAAVYAQNYASGQYEGYLPVNAEPFITYSNENPNDYAIGKYAGLSTVIIPKRGFGQITVNLVITNLIAA